MKLVPTTAKPKALLLELAPEITAQRRRLGLWRCAAIVASVGVHGAAIAALYYWGWTVTAGDQGETSVAMITFQHRAERPEPPAEETLPPEPPPKSAPPVSTPVDQTTPDPSVEVPIIEVVMVEPPQPQLLFQPAAEFVEPSVEFEPDTPPEPEPEPQTSKPPKPSTPTPPTGGSPPSKPTGKTIAARPIRTPSPTYPSSAASKKIEGTAILMVSIDAKGKVTAVQLTKSSGNSALDQAAQAGVRKWRFSPAKKDGVAVASKLRAPIAFRLP